MNLLQPCGRQVLREPAELPAAPKLLRGQRPSRKPRVFWQHLLAQIIVVFEITICY